MSAQVKIKDVEKGTQVYLGDIPVIKVSHTIVEINSGIESLSCYVLQDLSIVAPTLTPENDPFLYGVDPEKRICGDTLVTVVD